MDIAFSGVASGWVDGGGGEVGSAAVGSTESVVISAVGDLTLMVILPAGRESGERSMSEAGTAELSMDKDSTPLPLSRRGRFRFTGES